MEINKLGGQALNLCRYSILFAASPYTIGERLADVFRINGKTIIIEFIIVPKKSEFLQNYRN
jgi:hypothetical protein